MVYWHTSNSSHIYRGCWSGDKEYYASDNTARRDKLLVLERDLATCISLHFRHFPFPSGPITLTRERAVIALGDLKKLNAKQEQQCQHTQLNVIFRVNLWWTSQ